MESKILFKNETTYTQEIAMEAGDAFWETQPAYKKKAKKFKIIAGVLAVTFVILGGILIAEKGFGIIPMSAFVMAIMAGYGFLKGESLIRNSAKNFQGMGTKVEYGISENYFFVINREYMNNEEESKEEPKQEAIEAPAEAEEPALEGEEPEEEPEEQQETAVEPASEPVDDEDEENEYENEFLSLEELLVCIVTKNLYILIWERPYYILDRAGFEDGKDEEFRQFIEDKVRIIEA